MKRPARRDALLRDHARPLHAPAPTDAAIEARLLALLGPAARALVSRFRGAGLRHRVLTLPVMTAFVLALIWRQVPAVTTLVALFARESFFGIGPVQVSQQAVSQRLRTLPASLFGDLLAVILPDLHARAAARTRPLAPLFTRLAPRYPRIWAADSTALEAVFKKVGMLRDTPGEVLGGAVLSLLDVQTGLPHHLWFDEQYAGADARWLARMRPTLLPGTLVLFDRGFWSHAWFDWLSGQAITFVTRWRAKTVMEVVAVLQATPRVRDRIVSVGRKPAVTSPLRLVEVLWGTRWHAYLTNELDPAVLAAAEVVDLYAERWRAEDAFLLVKRVLGLSYLWTGSSNGVQLQCWASWLLYAVLVDLTDAVAEARGLARREISVEMTFRALAMFVLDRRAGKPEDVLVYLADPANDDLGIVKRARPAETKRRLDNRPPELNL
jgi:hypothetical protein